MDADIDFRNGVGGINGADIALWISVAISSVSLALLMMGLHSQGGMDADPDIKYRAYVADIALDIMYATSSNAIALLMMIALRSQGANSLPFIHSARFTAVPLFEVVLKFTGNFVIHTSLPGLLASHTIIYRLKVPVTATMNRYFVLSIYLLSALYWRNHLSQEFNSRKYFFRGLEKSIRTKELKGLGMHPKRLVQMVSKIVAPVPGHLESDVWFDIVAYTSDTQDGVRTQLEKHKWLRSFILPPDQDDPEGFKETFMNFQGPRVEFDLRPGSFVETVERFSTLLRTRDLCRSLFRYLGREKDAHRQDEKLRFWFELQAKILDIMRTDKNRTFRPNEYELNFSTRVLESIQRLRESGLKRSQSSAADKLQSFLEHSFDDKELKIKDTIEDSWREEQLRLLRMMFRSYGYHAILIELSDFVKTWLKDPRVLSAEHEKFESNICRFVETLVGRKMMRYGDAVQVLREMSLIKNEQSKTLYDAIEKQQTALALLQQTITCLEYRYTLEHLPQTDTPCMTALAGTNSGTGAWQKMWRLAVENELDQMIKDHINPPPPAVRPAPLAPGTIPPIPPPTLRPLLDNDFQYWAKDCAALAAAKASGTVPTAIPAPAVPAAPVPAAAPTAPPPPPRGRRARGAPPAIAGTWTTGNHICIEVYRPDYETWPSFQCGYNLYGELSGCIHQYSRSYDVHETNFTRSYRSILHWLRPDADAFDPVTKEVNWQKVWTNRGLPV